MNKATILSVIFAMLFSTGDYVAAQEELKPTVIWALGEIGEPSTSSFIYEQLSDRDLFMKIFALRALGNINDPNLLPRIKMVQENNKLILMYLNALKAKLGDEEGKDKIRSYLNSDIVLIKASALNLIRTFQLRDFLDEVYNFLGDKEPILRRKAIEALKDMDQSKRALKAAILYMNDENPEVSRMALLYICWADVNSYYKKLSRKDAASFLKELRDKLDEKDIYIRSFAKVTLGKLNDKNSLKIMRDDLSSPDTFLHASSVCALAYAKDFDIIPILTRDLLDTKFSYIDREYLIYALKVIQGYSYEDAARASRRHKDYITYSLKDKNVNINILLGDSVPVKNFFIEALSKPASNQHIYAAEVLGFLGDREATPYLINTIEDEKSYVQFSSIRSLGQIRDKIAAPALVEFFEEKFAFKKSTFFDLFDLNKFNLNKGE